LPNKEYISYRIAEPDTAKQEILVAWLQEFDFDGFEQTDTFLIANGSKETLDDENVEVFLKENSAVYSKSIVEEENWNKMWESDFPPIVIDKFCAVRAGFHPPIEAVQYEIIIDPKMSFGTGHHATTWMMMKAMEAFDFRGKSVLDFGSGTGLLAILAEKMGAETIAAIDYDDWCIENGKENLAANNCIKTQLIKADNLEDAPQSDIILANINLNIILANFNSFKAGLNRNGFLLISGILKQDENTILTQANFIGLKMVDKLEKHGWLCICFHHAA